MVHWSSKPRKINCFQFISKSNDDKKRCFSVTFCYQNDELCQNGFQIKPRESIQTLTLKSLAVL